MSGGKRVAAVIGAVVAVSLITLAVIFLTDNEIKDELTYEETPHGLAQMPDDPWGIDWAHWREVNPDVIGWIIVDDTNIDYPIMQASEEDPDYYLTHDVYKKKTRVGVPFVDWHCDGLYDQAVWIYGHHTRYQNMFTALSKFRDKDYAKAHKVHILTQDPDTRQTVELDTHTSAARIMNARKESQLTFSDRKTMNEWYEKEYRKCPMKLSEKTDDQSIIALVTCSYTTYANERTVVYLTNQNPEPDNYAVEVQVEKGAADE